MRRWMMLALGTAAQTVACTFLYGLPYTSEALRRDNGLSLGQVGLLVACPTMRPPADAHSLGSPGRPFRRADRHHLRPGHDRRTPLPGGHGERPGPAGRVPGAGRGGERIRLGGQRPARHRMVLRPGTRPRHGDPADVDPAGHGRGRPGGPHARRTRRSRGHRPVLRGAVRCRRRARRLAGHGPAPHRAVGGTGTGRQSLPSLRAVADTRLQRAAVRAAVRDERLRDGVPDRRTGLERRARRPAPGAVPGAGGGVAGAGGPLVRPGSAAGCGRCGSCRCASPSSWARPRWAPSGPRR